MLIQDLIPADAAEKIAGDYSDIVYLGVGLHSSYESAQRMYVKRGYVPDGSGVWYGSSVCMPYGACCNRAEEKIIIPAAFFYPILMHLPFYINFHDVYSYHQMNNTSDAQKYKIR